jgi:hypothetical protein
MKRVMPMDEVWFWIANISGVLGIVTTGLAAYSAFVLWRQSRRLAEQARVLAQIEGFDQLREYHEGVDSPAPVALALSLTPNAGSIRRSVKSYIAKKGWSMEILEIEREGIRPADLKALIEEFRAKRRIIDTQGFTEVHVFFSGPVAAAIIFGALYDNWIPVKVYQKVQASDDYEYWSPLFS